MKEEYLLSGSLEPTNEPYAIAKIAAIKLCRYYNEQYGTNFISVMPTNLYGPKDNFNFETSHVLPAMIRKFYLAKKIEEGNMKAVIENLKSYPIGFGLDDQVANCDESSIIKLLEKIGIHISFDFRRSILVTVRLWGSGNVYREFMHVYDLADAIIFLMEKVDASEMKNISSDYFINVGTGKDITIRDLAKMIKEIIEFKGNIEFDKLRPDGTVRKLLDVSKLHAMGWMHKIELEEGIKKVIEIMDATHPSDVQK